jgi:hypothetical protein
MRLKGRHWLMVWLLIFLGVLVAITARQSAGFRTARRLRDLREQRTTLEARRADLERQIRVASSRQVLIPIAERELGLHLPSDSEFTLLVLPTAPAAGR